MGLTTPYAIESDDKQDQQSRRPKKVRVLMPGPDFREMNKRNIGCPKEEKIFVPLREGKEFLEKRREENERRRMVGKAEIHGKTTGKRSRYCKNCRARVRNDASEYKRG